MNNVKYRAWLKNEKKMVDVKSIHFGTKKIMYGYSKGPQNYGTRSCKFEDCILMPCFIHQDKNKRDIFDGDILYKPNPGEEVSWNDYFYISYNPDKAWCTRYFLWGDRSADRPIFNPSGYGGVDVSNLEVIGNIYENKKLLEKLKCTELIEC